MLHLYGSQWDLLFGYIHDARMTQRPQHGVLRCAGVPKRASSRFKILIIYDTKSTCGKLLSFQLFVQYNIQLVLLSCKSTKSNLFLKVFYLFFFVLRRDRLGVQRGG